MLDLSRFLSSSFIAACPERVEGKQSPPWQEGDRHAEKAPARDDVKVSFLVAVLPQLAKRRNLSQCGGDCHAPQILHFFQDKLRSQ